MPTQDRWLIALVFVLLVAVRIPFYMTHHIQEDAFISFRCAVNLADTGVYGFNPGERVSASSSHLYVFWVAIARLLSGSSFIPVVLVGNTVLLLLGTYFLAGTIFRGSRSRLWLWCLLSLFPVSLGISYLGMETPLLIFALGILIYGLHRGRWFAGALACLALLPWIRPDAIAFGGIVLLWQWMQKRRLPLLPVLALLLGVLSLLLFNRFYFGQWLQQTILAKATLSSEAPSVQIFFGNLYPVFLSSYGVFGLLPSKYLDRIGPIVGLLCLVVTVIRFRRTSGQRDIYLVQVLFVFLAVLPPLAYLVGGVLFPWYFWPCSLFAFLIPLAWVVDLIASHQDKRVRQLSLCAVIGVFLFLGLGRWMLSVNWGYQEGVYRRGIGEYVRNKTREDATLLLEPAGYIPFYAERYTYDEIGLVAPIVVDYRLRHGEKWWVKFVQEIMPDLIIQRSRFLQGRLVDDQRLTDEESAWFFSNYLLLKEFDYKPQEQDAGAFIKRLLRLGSASSYYLYERVN